jgi:hypothetical protein
MKIIVKSTDKIAVEFTRDEVVTLRHFMGCLPCSATNLQGWYATTDISSEEADKVTDELFDILADTVDEWEDLENFSLS